MPAVRPGDWQCTACGNHNFASRTHCNKCAAPRDEAGQDMDGSEGDFAPAAQPRVRPTSSPYGRAGCGQAAAAGAGPSGVQAAIAAAYESGRMAGRAEFGGAGRGGLDARPQRAPARAGGGGAPEMKEGDWMCRACGNHNFASRVNCNKCGAVREGMKEGDWICRNCKAHNFAKNQACHKCQAPRAPDQYGRGGGAGKGAGGGCFAPPGPGAGFGPGAWPMGPGPMAMGPGMMGMMPPMMMGMPPMPMGGGPRVMGPMVAPKNNTPKGMKDGDWICPQCANHNFASRAKCNKCNALRPGLREGDWICYSCKNHNFASRTECKKCGAPRQDAPA